MQSLKQLNETVPTIYEQMVSRGVDRREFLKFCAWMGAYLGLESSAAAQIAKAIETKRRIPVVWLHFQECTCCSESFIRSSHPIVADILLDKVSLDYTETLQAAAGYQAEEILHDTITKYKGEYLMLVEGSVPLAADGHYCVIAGKSALETVREVAAGAKAIIAWGNCASSGCVQAANPNPTQAMPVSALRSRPCGRGRGSCCAPSGARTRTTTAARSRASAGPCGRAAPGARCSRSR